MISSYLLAGSALLGAVTGGFASGLPQIPAETISSTASCTVSSISRSSSKSVEVAAVAIKEIDHVLCGPYATGDDWDRDSAHKVATAFAKAIVDVSVDCYASGNAEYKVNGNSVAYAEAEALAKALAYAEANGITCDKCKASASSIIGTFKKYILEATASAEIDVKGVANGGTVEEYKTVFIKSFLKKTVIAFARVLVEARGADDECTAYIKAKTGAGDIYNPDTSTCELNVHAYESQEVYNAVSHAALQLAATACDASSSLDYDIVVKSVAEATAIAVSSVAGSCVVEGFGFACALGASEMHATAQAIGAAFASVYADAIVDCPYSSTLCSVDTEVFGQAVGTVVAKATSYATDKQCATPGNPIVTVHDYEKKMHTAYLDVLSKLFAQVHVTYDGECKIDVDILTKMIPHHPYPHPKPHPKPHQPLPKPQKPTRPHHPKRPNHPKRRPQHPKRRPQHPKRRPQHPKRRPQHPKRRPQHPKRRPHPRRRPQHKRRPQPKRRHQPKKGGPRRKQGGKY